MPSAASSRGAGPAGRALGRREERAAGNHCEHGKHGAPAQVLAKELPGEDRGGDNLEVEPERDRGRAGGAERGEEEERPDDAAGHNRSGQVGQVAGAGGAAASRRAG